MKNRTFNTNIKVIKIVEDIQPMCRCPKCKYTWTIHTAMTDHEETTNKLDVNLWDQFTCNYCPNCAYPMNDSLLYKLKQNIESDWANDPRCPESKFDCGKGHFFDSQEEAETYRDFHITKIEKKMCDFHGIIINAPVE